MAKRPRAHWGSLFAAAVLPLAVPTGAVAATNRQCATFARLASVIQIFGDAYTWWRQAVGKYEEGFSPRAGAVLCFKPQGRMRLGHVAVVSQVLTDRVVQITHANWSLIDGSRGQIEKNVTVVDVSPQGDWSQVKVWYDPNGNLGTTVYPTYGFIYAAAQKAADAVGEAFANATAAVGARMAGASAGVDAR